MESASIQQRIRYVNIMYFMEDDTITVMEPPIMVNCSVARRLWRSINNGVSGFRTNFSGH